MSPSLPTPRDSHSKLLHILRLSAQIFAQRGFQRASIRDISRATGISLSGLYYYFESKQKLLYLIQKNAFTYIIEALTERLRNVRDPQARLRLLVQNHLEYFLAHPCEMRVLSHEEDALDEPLRKEIAAIKRSYYSQAREILEDVLAEVPGSTLNPRLAILTLFGMMNWVYQWHNLELDPGAEELTNVIVGIFLHGILPGAPEVTEFHLAELPAVDS
jgi:AcrR family transcriptional regulator